MRKASYGVLVLIVAMVAVSSSLVFFNDWILRSNVPPWLRTVVYLVNPPDKLRSAVLVSEVVEGVAYVGYVNEYYGRYAIYLANDELAKEHVIQDSKIAYEITCNDGRDHVASGNIETLPGLIWSYVSPTDVSVGSGVECAVRVDYSGAESIYVVVNKLFDI